MISSGIICNGKNCHSIGGKNHSDECIAEHESATGMTPENEKLLQANSMDIIEAINGIKKYFDGQFFSINDIASSLEIDADKTQKNTDCSPFDHCYISQDAGGGIAGDDFHGTVYFHVGNNQYLVVEY